MAGCNGGMSARNCVWMTSNVKWKHQMDSIRQMYGVSDTVVVGTIDEDTVNSDFAGLDTAIDSVCTHYSCSPVTTTPCRDLLDKCSFKTSLTFNPWSIAPSMNPLHPSLQSAPTKCTSPWVLFSARRYFVAKPGG